jgi:hypothetical protein
MRPEELTIEARKQNGDPKAAASSHERARKKTFKREVL